MSEILSSPFAGTWYPADPDELRSTIVSWMEESGNIPEDHVFAVVMPHAGYAYSGSTAASAMACVRGKVFDRVVILAPSHRVYIERGFVVPEAEGAGTPLGKVNFDTDILDSLTRAGAAVKSDRIHLNEHSAQLEYPFLQCALEPGFKVIPLICCSFPSAEERERLAGILRTLDNGKTFFVVSSDFTHYGKCFNYIPFQDNISENLMSLDTGAYALMEKRDFNSFDQYIAKTGATICGETGISLLLRILPGNTSCRKTGYAQSGSMTGSWSESVSYLSCVFSRRSES